MYYIVNETNQIIAADESLLTLCGVTHINELSSNITLEKLTFNIISDNQLILTQNNNHHTFPTTSTPLSSLLGKLTLITIHTDTQVHTEDLVEDIDIDALIIKTDKPNDNVTIIDDIEKEIEIDTDTEETLFHISPKDLESPTLYGLTETPVEKAEETSPRPEIIIDITKISEEIGVSKEDFNLFLNEYIDTALDLEEDLKSSNNKVRSSAIQTLLHLSEVLHLDVVDNILEEINTSSDVTRTTSVSSFYDALSRITTIETNKTMNDIPLVDTPSLEVTEEEPKTDDDIILFDLGLTEAPKKKEEIPKEAYQENIDIYEIEAKPKPTIEKTALVADAAMVSFGEIDLSAVEAIHFDFQLSAAADELSLPESLIEEFMIDFVEQAHTETKNMLSAYTKGDLKTINKIGHLLKGVSSNLRITTLADTLYQIQFCEEPTDLENLIKDYWGHFLFFEKQINMLSN